jgi:hypothetical protein
MEFAMLIDLVVLTGLPLGRVWFICIQVRLSTAQ